MEKRLRFIRLASFVIIIGISGVKTEAYESNLEGKRAPCRQEGEPVGVGHIDKLNCFTCHCKLARGIRWPVSDRAVFEKFCPGQGLFKLDLDAVLPQVKYSITLRHNLANRSCRFLTLNRNTKFHRKRQKRIEDENENLWLETIEFKDTVNSFFGSHINGFVECQSEYYCPPREGCHMLGEKTKNGCCRKCKGCIYNGIHHSSHTEWTDPDNPCKVLRCEAGVVTVSDLQCYTPCANPLPPEPGKCCRTCPECKINGQEATDDRDVISDDPCLKCRCNKGKMTCSKRACPVLQCTPKTQYHPPGECCPVCRGTRAVMTVSKSCRLQDSFMWEEQKFSIDKCTNCTCRNETSICQRSACPVLDCAPDLQKSVPGSCCKQCIMPEEVKTQCSQGGKYYEDGQSWKLDACRSCKCHRGMPSCAMTRCNVTLPCAPGTKLVHLPGECCEKCVQVDGVCMVFGDPHYKTFDGKMYTFQGIGKYMLVSECKSQSFSIRVANDYPNKTIRNSVITKRVAIRYGDLRLNLQQKGRIKLNRKKVTLPYKKEGKLRIEKKNGNIEVTLQNGVKIFWNGKSFLEVSVPAVYKNKVCGLCGNFNGNSQDELKTKRGHEFRDSEILNFGASWCVGSKASCAASSRNSRQIARISFCNNHRSAKNQKNRCKDLSNPELFGECDSKLNYFKYYKMCKMDMCKCPNGKCYCDSLMAYARECEKLGVKIPSDWKAKSSCHEDNVKKIKTGNRKLSFTKADIERSKFFMRQKNFNNRTRNPISIQ